MLKFTHLHVHTEYSLLDGLAKIKDCVQKAQEEGMESLAITDHGTMYGVIKFYSAAKAGGIKPIIGCEFYVATRSRFDKQPRVDSDQYHLVLLAKNETGYKNLLQLTSKAHLEGYYYKPRIDLDLLKEHNEGLIAMTACLGGQVPHYFLIDEDEKAKESAVALAEIFGRDNFFLELQRHQSIPVQEKVNQKMIKLSQTLGLPLIASCDAHYISSEDALAQKILVCIQKQVTLTEEEKQSEDKKIHHEGLYLKTPSEMESLFADLPQALENTQRIARMCDLELNLGNWILPHFPVPEGYTPASYLRHLCQDRIHLFYDRVTEEIRDRLEYELSVIEEKKYPAYFLIVQDFVNWAREKGISVGPGRGSAAGSLVSYVLGITSINPFFFKLPFERFLNRERPSPPDIDLDFADDRRDEVIEYVTQRYGQDKVAQIITFGTMEARGSIRDVGRVLGMPYSEPDKIAKLIPFGMAIKQSLENVPELRELYQTEEKYKRLLDLAQKLEGVARHASTHAAGVVIADKPLVEYVPLQKEARGERTLTQYDMYTVGEDGVGLLKMDFLGLSNLTILQETLKIIKKEQDLEIDLTKIPLDDQKTYKMLSKGETTGIFQMESAGMRKNIIELKPTTIFDLSAMVALYRPGPIQILPEFVARKNNPALIKYPDPRLKDILKESYGLIVYQDDVLLTAIILAGYSWAEADGFRKAMGKKIKSVMEKQRDKFISGCVNGGMTQSKAEELFHYLEPFAGYAFNKAHASCYATIAYQTAYLKANFPAEFMCAILTVEAGNEDKISQAAAECQKIKIPILPPDINFSNEGFSLEKIGSETAIRFGLSAIKNLGLAAIEVIIAAREKDGRFLSLSDFCQRVDLQKVNRKTLESLIKVGAFDGFGKRAAQLKVVDQILDLQHREQKKKSNGQIGLFELEHEENQTVSLKLPDIEEFPLPQLLTFEKQLLGFYLTAHPQAEVLHQIRQQVSHKIGELDMTESLGQKVLIGGILVDVRKTFTKQSNAEMAFIKIEDETGQIEAVVFPKVFAANKSLWVQDQAILLSGRVDSKRAHDKSDNKEERLSLIIEEGFAPTEENLRRFSKLVIINETMS